MAGRYIRVFELGAPLTGLLPYHQGLIANREVPPCGGPGLDEKDPLASKSRDTGPDRCAAEPCEQEPT